MVAPEINAHIVLTGHVAIDAFGTFANFNYSFAVVKHNGFSFASGIFVKMMLGSVAISFYVTLQTELVFSVVFYL